MTEQKTLEQRVREDLMSDGPPLSNQEYLGFVKANFPYYTYDPPRKGFEKKLRYYNRGEGVTKREYDEIMKKERHFCLDIRESGEYKLDTNNAESNIRNGKTPQLEKFRSYLREKYPKLFENYLKLGKRSTELTLKTFDLLNEGRRDLAEALSEENKEHFGTYNAYTIKLCLILNEYNQKVPEEDVVVGIEG